MGSDVWDKVLKKTVFFLTPSLTLPSPCQPIPVEKNLELKKASHSKFQTLLWPASIGVLGVLRVPGGPFRRAHLV